MSIYVPKEIVLNNLEIPEGVSILYSTWTIRDEANTIVHYTEMDEVNLTSKIFTDVFEVGKKYYVTMSMVRTDGPTIDTRPLEVQVFSGEDTYNLYPMPSVIDTPVITIAYTIDNVPTNDIKFTGSVMIVAGNATHDYSHWWLTNDTNEVIWDSPRDQINKTEIIVSNVDLKRDRFYTMHCVYTGTNRDSSGTGNITFRPSASDELEISGDLSNSYYGYPIDTRLNELTSDMTLFEYKLMGDDIELYSTTNTTGEINIAGNLLTDVYTIYTLKVRLTTTSTTIGWKDIKFKPKEFIVSSDDWTDANIVYDNQIDVLTGKIYNYDNTTFKTPFISPAGKSYQLPNGEIILLRNNSKIGRFAFDDSKGVLRHIADLYIPQIPIMLDYNVFTFKIFNTGDILIGLGYTDYNIYHMKYDPINNTFKYLTTYTIANGGCQIYSEMHLVDNVVIFMSEGVNNSTQNIYGVHLVEQTLEVLATDIIANSKNGNLIRIDANTLLVRAGINKTTNTLLNNGKLLTLDIVGSTINLTITTDNRITLPSVELANNTALQATLKNNKVILKQFSPLELKSSDLTVVKYVYGDIEVVTADYSKGVVYGNKKYYAPRNSSRVMVVDLTTGVSSFIGADLGLTVDKYFYGVVADNDKIYFIPVNASKVLEIDPSTDIVTLIGDDLGSGTNKYHRPILASNGKIYCPPVNATQVLMINPSTPTATVISIILAATIRKYFTAITHTNGMIYCPPVNAGQVLKITPNTDTVSLVGTDLGAVVGKYYKSIVADNDRIYCTPLNASRVLEINPNNSDSTILIGDDLGIDNGKYVNGVLKGTDIYYAPLNTNKVLKVDTALTTAAVIGDDLTSIYDMGTMYDPTRVYSRYYAGLLADNGNIYYAPVYASKVLEINTTLDTTLLVGKTVGGFNMYVSGLKATNGRLYFIPYNTPDCLEVDPAGINNLIHSLNILATDKNSSAASNPFTYKSIGGEKFQFTIYLNNGKRVFMSYTKDNPKMLIYR